MSSWICDGKPKNPKYFGTGEEHTPQENYGSDCEHCGLPKEAIGYKKPGFSINPKLVGAIALFLVAATGIFVASSFKGDRHLKTYQQAMTSGDLALNLIRNHSNYAELEEAQNHLTTAIAQLNQIPVDASIYPDANQNINEFDRLSIQISNKLNNFDLCGIEPKPKSCIF